MKYELVTDGVDYAVKRTSWFGSVKFLSTGGYWWSKNSDYFLNCWGDKAWAERVVRRLSI